MLLNNFNNRKYLFSVVVSSSRTIDYVSALCTTLKVFVKICELFAKFSRLSYTKVLIDVGRPDCLCYMLLKLMPVHLITWIFSKINVQVCYYVRLPDHQCIPSYQWNVIMAMCEGSIKTRVTAM